jgi:hypothetical protein
LLFQDRQWSENVFLDHIDYKIQMRYNHCRYAIGIS